MKHFLKKAFTTWWLLLTIPVLLIWTAGVVCVAIAVRLRLKYADRPFHKMLWWTIRNPRVAMSRAREPEVGPKWNMLGVGPAPVNGPTDEQVADAAVATLPLGTRRRVGALE